MDIGALEHYKRLITPNQQKLIKYINNLLTALRFITDCVSHDGPLAAALKPGITEKTK